jgi:hypothetical protein
MTSRSETLAFERERFSRVWHPEPERRRDFEVELDRLIYAAVALGQEPFIRELNSYRDNTLKQSVLLRPPGREIEENEG